MTQPNLKSRHAGKPGWQESETVRLLTAVREASAAGAPLRSVFESLSNDLGRKPNSIRNYYYACLRQQPDAAGRPAAFRPFTPEETHELLRQVLIARGQGRSVRACVMALAQGSHSQMLRYQNKYRTILKTHPELIAQVCEELRQEGAPCPRETPSAHSDRADAAFCDPDDTAAARLMAEPCVHHMLEGIKELLRRAARAEAAPDEILQEKCRDLQRALDRQQVDHDLQRIAWEKDFDDCSGHLQAVVAALKECVTPDEQGESLSPAVIALQEAETFLERQRALAQ